VRERERNIVALSVRGGTFAQIARQLGLDESTVRKAWHRALKRWPKPDVEAMRLMASERIAAMREKIWGELADRPDPNDSAKTISSDIPVTELIDRALKIYRHEAVLFGLDAPSKQQVASTVIGQPISDEELDRQLARLTEEELDTFMRLTAKLQGRWVEPPPPPSIETTAWVVSTVSESEPSTPGSEAEQRPVQIEQCVARQDAIPERSARPRPQSIRDTLATPTSRLDFQPCPKCGRYAGPNEAATYNNGVPTFHQNCRPTRR